MGNTSSNSRRNSKVLPAHALTASAPPPPYTKRAQSTAPAPQRPLSHGHKEDALDILRLYDTVLIVDDSGSMEDLWEEACEVLAELAETAAKYDTNGIDIFFLNSKKRGEGLKNANQVRAIFNQVEPMCGTPLGFVIHKTLKAYIKKLEAEAKRKRKYNVEDVKPVNYIVITDGEPDDEAELENAIVKCAQFLDKHDYPLNQIGIQFVQIGDESDAARYLRHLDDVLKDEYNIRDMVDTEPYKDEKVTAAQLIKLLLGGINRRVDVKGGEVMLVK